MKPPDPTDPPPAPRLDALVRGHLDAEATRVDAARLWDRLAAQLDAADAPPVVPARGARRSRLRVAAGFATVAALLVAVFVLTPTQEALATPADVVESARTESRAEVDRCYTQTVQLPRHLPAPLSLLLESGRTVTVCTRGDRFVVTPGLGGRGAWGRDAEGRVWIAPTREAAARYTAAELPPPVLDMVKVRGLELGPILDEVLKDFDLAWADHPPARGAATAAIRATRRGDTFPYQLRSAELIVERQTRVVRSLVMHRQLALGEPITVSFTLTGTAERPPTDYTAEGHVDAGRPVYDASRPVLRRRVLMHNFGDILVNGL